MIYARRLCHGDFGVVEVGWRDRCVLREEAGGKGADEEDRDVGLVVHYGL